MMMENGDAFHAFAKEVVDDLSEVKVAVYFAEPMPSETDGRFQAIIRRFMADGAEERDGFQRVLPTAMRSLFGIYGHRAATLAAREAAGDWLLSGLVGYAIANYTIPQKRQVEVGLVVYHHVARKINVNPVDLFEAAATFAGSEAASRLLAFGRRGDVTLTKFGWEELKTPEGIKYKFSYG